MKNGNQNRWLKTFVAMSIISLLLVPILTACSKGNDNGSDKPRVLRIALISGSKSNTEYYRSQYTNLYAFTHKNVNIEFQFVQDYTEGQWQVPGDGKPQGKQPDDADRMIKLMESTTPPDVVIINYDDLPRYIDQNLLVSLKPLIEKDQFDISDFVPAVINGLKDMGNGSLYALAPQFSSTALIYNKKIFTDAQVEFPTDNMTWDQIFNLAKRVTSGEGDERISGFAFNTGMNSDMYSAMAKYIAPLGLQIVDDNGDKMMVNNARWEDAWNEMVKLKEKDILLQNDTGVIRPLAGVKKGVDVGSVGVRAGAIDGSGAGSGADTQLPSAIRYNSFLSGKTAMALIYSNELNDIIDANEHASTIEGFDGVSWDLVTFPVHDHLRGVGGTVDMFPLMAINAKAQNRDDAWDFIKFINGKDRMKLKSRGTTLVSRKDLINPIDGLDYHIKAFYLLKPSARSPINDFYTKHPGYYQVMNIGRQKFQSVMKGDLTVKDALQQWETAGNQAIENIKKAQSGDGGGGVIIPPIVY